MNAEKLKALWKKIDAKVKERKIRPLRGVENEETFLRLMSTPSNRRKFWDAVHTEYLAAGINLGEPEDFELIYGGDPLKKYVGTFKGEGVLFPSFDIIQKESKLYMKKGGIEVVLENLAENKYKGRFLERFEINFSVSGDSATGGTIVVGEDTINFSRVEPGSDFNRLNWIEISNTAWENLKKAGYWVKEEGGKLLAAIQNGLHVKKVDNSAWDCINKWNEGWGYFKLLTGFEGDRKFLFEYTSHKVDGKKVKLLYFEDGEVLMKFTDTNQNVAGGKGKWSCTDSGYKIVWQNGQVAVFGNSKSLPDTTQNGESNTTNSETTTSETPKFKEVCKAILPCPKRADVESGKASYKICMRCPEIAELQSNPVFKVIYFKKLKDRGFKESADGVFGPITKLAVEEYQEMNGLVKDGLIGQKTLAQLDKDKSGRK